ncbi:hypothetical protein [Nocardia brasiliensis]|uniref:hypothetical protein n=1 Tax=Nocardia brasiliensis TaxID=37326 RepID=UPI0036723BD5
MTVPASALGELILAVHEAAGQSGRPATRRWRYGNVVGISTPQVHDLALATVHLKHVIERRAIAAITVAVHSQIAVDVIFTLDNTVASAQFRCATIGPEPARGPEMALAESLATKTSAALDAHDIATEMSCGNASATD